MVGKESIYHHPFAVEILHVDLCGSGHVYAGLVARSSSG